MEFGGSLSINKRKGKRPIDISKSMHIVFRSLKARGKFRLNNFKNKRIVDDIIVKYSQRFDVKIYQFANARTHLHLLIKGKNRTAVQNFLRVVAGQIAQQVHGNGKFWDNIVYSKIVCWGRHYERVVEYIIQNHLEVLKIVPYKVRT